jgi:uncharacterized protein involved in exopolysaccharide biosynthesis
LARRLNLLVTIVLYVAFTIGRVLENGVSGERVLTGDVDIDLAGLAAEIWRKKWRLLAFAAIVGAGLVFVLSGVSPRYSASARLLIEKRESVFTRRPEGDQNLSSSQFDEQAVGSQVQVLTSDDIILKVITRLKLAQSPDFSDGARPGLLERVKAFLPSAREASNPKPEERILKKFRERLLVYTAEKSRVLIVEFWAHDPDLAQSVPNAIADEYLVIAKQSKLQADSEATGWLGPEIEELRGKVKEAEAKVAEFRASSDILLGTNNALLATQQLSEVSSELSRLRADRSSAEAKIAAVAAAMQSGGSIDAVPEVISSPLIQRLKERQVGLQAQISELSTSLLPGHPRLKALQSQVADFDGQIRAAARNILRSLENNVDLARKQETVLLKEVERLKAEAGRVGEAEVGLRALEREANAQRALLESYLTQFREAAGRQNRDYLPVDARIISRAVRPVEAYFPKIVPFAAAGATTALILGIVGVLAGALLSGRALRAVGREAEEPLVADGVGGFEPIELPRHDAPSLDNFDAPATGGRDAPAAANDPESFALEHALAAVAAMDRAVLAVVSPDGDAGAEIVVELARGLAAMRRDVAVMDLSGEGVSSRALLGDAHRPGLVELLRGDARLADVMTRDRQSTAQVLPCYAPARDEAELPVDRLAMLASSLFGNFEFVVLDCGNAGPQGVRRIVGGDAITLVAAAAGGVAQAGEIAELWRGAGMAESVIVRRAETAAGALAGAA